MKNAYLMAVAAMAMMTAPAAAQGYLGVEYGNGEISAGGPTVDGESWTGEGAFGFSGTGWGAQVDGSYGNISVDGGGDVDTITLGGHLWWAPGDNWRLGGVVTTTQVDGGGDSIDEWAYGVEGTYDFTPQAQLIASVTTGEVDDADLDTFNFDAGINFYLNPNMRLGGAIGVGNLEGTGGDADTMSYGVNGEFQPWAAPISITLGWNSFEIDDGGLDITTDVFQIGGRWNFGGGTLQERNNATPFDTNSGFFNRLLGVW